MTARPSRRRRRNQPVREVPGDSQGDRKLSADLQTQRPLPAPPAPGEGISGESPPGGGPPPNGQPPGGPMPAPLNIFGPSQSPTQESILPPDENSLIRALYTRFPNEDLRRLLERSADLVAQRDLETRRRT